MRKFALIAVAMTAGLGLAACSQKTEDKASETVDSASTDAATNAAVAGAAVSDAATDAAGAVDQAGEAVKNSAEKAKEDIKAIPTPVVKVTTKP